MAAPNITAEFITRLINNGRTAEGWRSFKKGLACAAFGPIGVAYCKYDQLDKFRSKVRAKGDWDFKSNWLKQYQKDGVEVAGKVYRYDMPGNFHYGFTGAALGVSEGMLFVQAGKAQRAAGTSKPEFHCTYGDDPEDHEFIRLGIKLYDDVGLGVTQANLAKVLSGFKVIVCGPYKDPLAGHERVWRGTKF